jgi:protein SPT2
MSSFAALMAMSKAQTAVNEAAVQSAISQREAKQRQEKEEAERRHKLELEKEAKLRQAQAEAARREEEKAKQRALAAKAKEAEAERKSKEQMEKILGKARHQLFEEREKGDSPRGTNGHKRRKHDNDSDDEGGGNTGQTLTRAEKRALKMDPDSRPAWAQQLVGSSKRTGGGQSQARPTSSHGSPSRPHGKQRRSQVDFSNYLSAPSSLGAQGDQSLPIRERLKSSDYFVPIKLAATQRDKRTQADYFQEKRQRLLATNGGSADQPFADWNQSKSDRGSGTDTKSKAKATSSDTNARGPVSLPFSTSGSRSTPNLVPNRPKPSTTSRHESPVGGRKRRRTSSISSDDLDGDSDRGPSRPIGGVSIWKLMTGKDRRDYADDVYSDEDDDMEVSAAEVAREEARA